MNEILSLREKRANLWDAAKKYRDAHICDDGTMNAEDATVYDRMQRGKRIPRSLRKQINGTLLRQVN